MGDMLNCYDCDVWVPANIERERVGDGSRLWSWCKGGFVVIVVCSCGALRLISFSLFCFFFFFIYIHLCSSLFLKVKPSKFSLS